MTLRDEIGVAGVAGVAAPVFVEGMQRMKIGYFMNTYPLISTTFIRREIEEIERLGETVFRYAVRRWEQPVVDPLDKAELGRTRYLLDGKLGLLGAFLVELASNPLGMLRALGLWARLLSNAGEGLVRHAAYLIEAARLKRWCAADGVEHLHTHFSTNSAAVAMLARRMGGPPYSFTAHGPVEFVDPSKSSLSLKVDHADFVVAISHFCRGQLVLSAGMDAWEKIHVVRCGVDLAEFAVGAPPPPDGPIVCVGRLCREKGQTLIPAIAAAVATAGRRTRIILVGDGEDRSRIERAIEEHGVAGAVEIAGWASNAAVREAILQARALMLPSFAEGLPIVLMEAFALGRPVVSTYIAGIPELVDARCGWLAPAGDVPALAEAVIEALDATPDRLAEMGAEGRRRVEVWHDLRSSARTLQALFRGARDAGSPAQAEAR